MPNNTVKLTKKEKTRIVAHRGVSGLETENTAAAFIAAGNRTYYGIETDIWHTADGQYICNHDGRTGRICEIDLTVENSNFNDLRKLKLKDKDGETDRAELCLPTLYEYAKICRKYEKQAIVELKSDFSFEEIREIMQIMGDLNYFDHTCFIAFNIANLDLVKQIRPTQECQFLTGKWEDSLPGMLASRGMDLDIEYKALTKERINTCHDLDIKINCWTVDDHEIAQQLISWGIDYITSNILE